MNLGEVHVGQAVTIQNVGGSRGFRRRLMELGLIPGTSVQVVAVAPLGDPLKLRVRGCTLSIRRAEACSIDVSGVNGAAQPVAPAATMSAARLEVGIGV